MKIRALDSAHILALSMIYLIVFARCPLAGAGQVGDSRPNGAGPEARGIRVPKQAAPLATGKRWAVVVGVGYNEQDRAEWKDRGEVRRLPNAEKDAGGVAKILREKYGYEEDAVFLLLGRQANRDAIEDLLREGLFCNGQKVGPDDSVLFYFAGHCFGPEMGAASADDRAYLLPIDAKVDDQGRPNTTFAIDIGGVAAKLRKESECRARHILMILDCCHSGAVFQMQGVD
ncbi:MAG: caspase family protein, partial [Isosphaeraceae bacterium]